MISGSFLITDKNYDFKQFYRKSLKNIFLPFIIALILQFIFEFIMKVIIKKDFSDVFASLKGIVDGSYNNMWFMYMLVGLYLITPILVRLKQSLNEKQYIIMTGILFVWSIISQATSRYKVSYTIGIVISFCAFFVMGDIIKTYSDNLKMIRNCSWICILLIILSLFITFIFRFYLNYNISRYVFEAYTAFFSPSIALFSLSLFTLFSLHYINVNFIKLSKLTFGIYLFHTCILKFINEYLSVFISNRMVYVVVVFFIVLTISIIVSIVFNYIINKLIFSQHGKDKIII